MSLILVHMPYAAVERPSIGLGILQSCLEQAGLKAEVIYANLLFAERVGLSRYRMVEFTPTDVLLGEWTFSGAAFPDFVPDHDQYFQDADLDVCEALVGPREKLRPVFEHLRGQAAPFVDELARDILERQPRVVGAGSTFQQHCASLALLRRIRELDPSVVTVLGGANCEGAMGRATHREFPWVDYVVSGEADELVVDLLRSILEGSPGELSPAVLTPAHRPDPPQPARGTVQQLDMVPTPRYDAYFEHLERLRVGRRIEPGLLVETSRGCWWGARHHCTFCGLNGTGMGFRSKSPQAALRDFESLWERYQVQRFEVVDNILDMRYFQTVLPELARHQPPLSIFYETKSNLRRDHVEQLAQAGIRWIQPGIESMHDEVLRHIDKGSTALTNVQLLKWTREFGVRVSWNFLSGFPGEKDEWYQEMAGWLPLIAHLQPPQEQSPKHEWTWRSTKIRYERFSPYHSRPADYGLALAPNRYYSYVYPLERGSLEELAYFFEDAADLALPRTGPPANRGPGLLALERWVDQWIRLYWGGPQPIILSMTDDGEKLRLVDTRPCATARFLCLDGEERELYLACDTPQTLTSLGMPSAELVEGLKRRHLLLELGGRLVALAVRGSLPAMPQALEFPGGCMDVEPSWRGRRVTLGPV